MLTNKVLSRGVLYKLSEELKQRAATTHDAATWRLAAACRDAARAEWSKPQAKKEKSEK